MVTKAKKPAKRVNAGTSKAAAAARRKTFVEAYLANGGNATQAAITAGFSAKTASSKGEQLLREVEVATEISRRRGVVLEAAQENTKLTVEGVLRELHGIVHSDLRKCFDATTGALLSPNQWPDDVARSMASIKVVEMAGGAGVGGGGVSHIPMYVKEVKFWDKNSAIEKAMKTLGLLIDRKEVGEPGAFDRMDDDDLTRAERETDEAIAAARTSATANQKAGDSGRAKTPKTKA